LTKKGECYVRNLLVFLFVFAGACAPLAPSLTPTQTPFVVPVLPDITVTPTRTPIVVSPTPAPPTPVAQYVVAPGDTLSAIAKKFGLEVSYLAWLNNIANPDVIYPGQVLKLAGEVETPKATNTTGRQIIVKLSAQRLFAYEDGKLLATFTVSTGIAKYPTRVGDFPIWVKLEHDRMTGPGYDLPGVPWVMYFDGDRGLHGKYWNDIYGRPSSHGCVNLRIEDAGWLYSWAEVGDIVSVIE